MSTGPSLDPVQPAGTDSDALLHRICGEIATWSLHLKVEVGTGSTTFVEARRIVTEYAYDLLRAHSASVVDSRAGYLGLTVAEVRRRYPWAAGVGAEPGHSSSRSRAMCVDPWHTRAPSLVEIIRSEWCPACGERFPTQ